MPSLLEDLSVRGLLSQESAGLEEALAKSQMTAYYGIDPSAGSLHVGNLIGVMALRRLAEAGCKVIALTGGGTGMIGDPGGRDRERPLLGRDEVAANVEKIRHQLEGLIDLDAAGSGSAMLLDNSSWLSETSLIDFLRDVGKHFSVNQMVAKESVRARMARDDEGISFTEFSYMLLQAYDYLHLFDSYGCRLQIGGSDQWGNITMGIDLIRRARGEEAHAFTWPLLTRPDGSKLGKSDAGELAWLDPERTSPYAFYQHFLRKSDDEVGQLLRHLTLLSIEEIQSLDEATSSRPKERQSQRTLARELTATVHGSGEAARAEKAAAALYTEEIGSLDEAVLLDVLADAPSSRWSRSELEGSGLDLAEALARSGLSPSKGAARTAISQGGAYVNNVRRHEEGAAITPGDLLYGRYVVLRRGKREQHLAVFE